MECNRDEAKNAISVAEGKLVEKDYDGARTFALKAQTLYPTMEGVSKILTTIDVLLSAEKKTDSETINWYDVLSVEPSANNETIRKRYRKLAMLVHPDKNNFAGSDCAFKLIGKAWSVLSDQTKRAAYDLTTPNPGSSTPPKTENANAPPPKHTPANEGTGDDGPSAPAKPNGFQPDSETRSAPRKSQSVQGSPTPQHKATVIGNRTKISPKEVTEVQQTIERLETATSLLETSLDSTMSTLDMDLAQTALDFVLSASGLLKSTIDLFGSTKEDACTRKRKLYQG